ncbi:2Fe-2S iron-sulfur cluster binding domain-containing protein [Ktedonosporobacter rubrisoli]|uniref:2Fe-2S iron-sulfur cluster binding domain-containing protein n=1 Tax=Ktedonosporobacter rubrisoli TaxID=2509675 RepID=A0A4V0Z030_KTERU|nr:molybdopterin cofactor-binding domain-containing protein [Ktedonosporobacter rubrisoli]QBD81791.1 2Fe-2S iron-sulfur cluster binding domain-containing protein [Ktedonosporobacter rubrisoli]
MELELRINGVITNLDVAPNESLMNLLRREGHCGVRHGCESGECGACTVLVDGTPRPSCVMLAAQAGGCTLTTIEGVGTANQLHQLQQAFSEIGAVQCGFCTPGMLLSAYALLKRNPDPTEQEVRDALSGNLCRCTGYAKPVQAVLRAAAMMRQEAVSDLEYNVIKHPANDGNRINNISRITAKMPALTSAALQGGAQPENQLRVIGKPIKNIDATKLVTGQAAFTTDVSLKGMLYGRVLTSPHAHAVIRDIDVSEARTVPGVHAVLTYKDVPRIPYSSVERADSEIGPFDQYCLDYIVRYAGDRVAAVAAETPEAAEEALKLIQVTYDVLPAILDPRQALAPNAPKLHPESESRGIYDPQRNIAARVRAEVGDIDHGFAEAELIVEGEYFVPQVQQAPLENHSAVTYFDENNYLVVRTNAQAAHHIRRTLARLLDIPARRIRIDRPASNNAPNMKQEIVLEDICALLTATTKLPVMLEFSRAEEFRSSRSRQPYILRMKTGVKKDGTLVANQMILLTSTGAYGTHPLISQEGTASRALALYPCPHMRFLAEILYTNQQPSAAMHGWGMAQEFFALESQMDEVARQLGIDALTLRRKNWLKAGDEYPLAGLAHKSKGLSLELESSSLSDCLRIVEEKLRWKERHGKAIRNGHIRHGVGIALSLHGSPATPTGTSGAIIKLNEEGSFDVFAGINSGGGDADTLLAQIAAEILGVSMENILIHTTTTATSPFETSATGTSTFYANGGAVKKAAEQVLRQMLTIAGRMLNALPEALKLVDGIVSAPNGQKVSIAQIAEHAFNVENRHIMATASWKSQYTPITFAAQGVEVTVDTETGQVHVLKAITAVDTGRVLNPLIAETQVQGSVALALGASISEELIYDQQGSVLTTTLSDYRIFNAADMPEMETYLVESNDPSDLFGAKVTAEVALNGIAPAIANAVVDALGVRVRQLPLTPERVLRSIHAARK